MYHTTITITRDAHADDQDEPNTLDVDIYFTIAPAEPDIGEPSPYISDWGFDYTQEERAALNLTDREKAEIDLQVNELNPVFPGKKVQERVFCHGTALEQHLAERTILPLGDIRDLLALVTGDQPHIKQFLCEFIHWAHRFPENDYILLAFCSSRGLQQELLPL